MEELASAQPRHTGLKVFKIVAGIILALLFIASLAYAVLSGGEILEKPAVDNRTKGLIRLESPNYQQEYFDGDAFTFDKDLNKVTLVAKVPSIETIVKIDDLPGPEYGFKVRQVFDENGKMVDPSTIEENAILKPKEEESTAKSAFRIKSAEDETVEGDSEETEEPTEEEEEEAPIYTYVDTVSFVEEAEKISVSKDMGTIYLVSKRYQDLMIPLDYSVIEGQLNEEGMAKELLFEAENADIYKDDTLLTEEELSTLPDTNKPFLSSKGSTIAGTDCSGGACLRSFGSNNMKIDFQIVSKKAADVNLTIKVCKRPSAGLFNTFYKFTLNNVTYADVDSQEIPAGSSGQYYETYDMVPVSVHIQRGVNHFVFQSGNAVGTSSPVNFDAIHLAAEEDILGTMANIVLGE